MFGQVVSVPSLYLLPHLLIERLPVRIPGVYYHELQLIYAAPYDLRG
jgi:hypothetical protein